MMGLTFYCEFSKLGTGAKLYSNTRWEDDDFSGCQQYSLKRWCFFRLSAILAEKMIFISGCQQYSLRRRCFFQVVSNICWEYNAFFRLSAILAEKMMHFQIVSNTRWEDDAFSGFSNTCWEDDAFFRLSALLNEKMMLFSGCQTRVELGGLLEILPSGPVQVLHILYTLAYSFLYTFFVQVCLCMLLHCTVHLR
jgi:hypothetical protein